MRRIFLITCLIALIVGLLVNTGCKETFEETYTLTVLVTGGVIGEPVSGDYSYVRDEEVNYSYELESDYINLVVILDNVEVEPSGTITILKNHVLIVSAEVDISQKDYTLTVTLGHGVSGNPLSGTYYYDEGEESEYSYSVLDGFSNFTVTLDGAAVDASGTITFSQDHVLEASAENTYDISGSWDLGETYTDGSSFSVILTFIGDMLSGTVEDSDGGTGTYTVNGHIVEFTLEYPNITYSYIGAFSEENKMSGDSKRETDDETYSGIWAAERNSQTSTANNIFLKNKGKSKSGK